MQIQKRTMKLHKALTHKSIGLLLINKSFLDEF